MFTVHRSSKNPIIQPNHDHSYESNSTFNGNPVQIGKTTHLLYRAQSTPETFENTSFSLSIIAKAKSTDGKTFAHHKPYITPEETWERYGCEDPRTTNIGGTFYTFYTALGAFPFNANCIKVGLAISGDLEHVSEKHLITPFNAKAMALFPEKINGKYTAVLSVNTDLPPAKIAIAQFEKLEDMLSQAFWEEWYAHLDDHILNLRRHDDDQVEVGAVPIKTKSGWLLVYSHISNYHSSHKIFGIEAVLLDLKNPNEIVGRTSGPMLVPEESYEKYGIVPNIIFPSGALLEKDTLKIYYGACDTVCALAEVHLPRLIDSMTGKRKKLVARSELNPILKPTSHTWEQRDVFNPAAVDAGGSVHIIYRAMSKDNTSVFGYAAAKNGIRITDRGQTPIYVPREPFERKGIPGGNSGCEDPRITKIGGMMYMCYTAYNGIEVPAVALTSITVENFLKKKWTWSKPILISPSGVDDKDACIVDHKQDGKYLFLHRINNNLVASYIDLEHPERVTDYKTVIEPRAGMWDGLKVGISTPPIKTKFGWLLPYHGVSHSFYRVGLLLLDLDDPTQVIARTSDYIFDPMEQYEREGEVPNVVFPCGIVERGGKIFLYYGAADKVVGVATANLEDLLKTFF